MLRAVIKCKNFFKGPFKKFIVYTPAYRSNTLNILYNIVIILSSVILIFGRAVALWFRHYATNLQVAGSIPDGVIGNFQ
jgi:hypothetical protein